MLHIVRVMLFYLCRINFFLNLLPLQCIWCNHQLHIENKSKKYLENCDREMPVGHWSSTSLWSVEWTVVNVKLLRRAKSTSSASCRPLIQTISATWHSRRSWTSWLARPLIQLTPPSKWWHRSVSWLETRWVQTSQTDFHRQRSIQYSLKTTSFFHSFIHLFIHIRLLDRMTEYISTRTNNTYT